MPAEFRLRVVAVIEALRPGEVVSYGDVAAQAGYPGAARGVGSVLSATDGLPWWRVVMVDGRLAPGKESEQGRRLRAEGVSVVNGRVAGRSRRGGRR
jgi:methylated-DNA-protein-cysteine methyltransferase-like protein